MCVINNSQNVRSLIGFHSQAVYASAFGPGRQIACTLAPRTCATRAGNNWWCADRSFFVY